MMSQGVATVLELRIEPIRIDFRGDVHVMGDHKAAWFEDPDGNLLSVVA
jgi:hypothetical protein